MKIHIFQFVVMILVLISSGCNLSDRVVLDHQFEFQFGQGSGLNGLNILKIASDGNAVYEFHKNRTDWNRKTFVIDQTQLNALVEKINSLNVLGMKNNYQDSKIYDGSQWCLLIRFSGKMKSIYFNNQFPSEINHLSDFIHQTIIEPLGSNAETIRITEKEARENQRELWGSIQPNESADSLYWYLVGAIVLIVGLIVYQRRKAA
jgi:hypothetical protein